MEPCSHCGTDECNYQRDDEPCYGAIKFETRDAYEQSDGSVDEYEMHSCDGHRGSGWERAYRPASAIRGDISPNRTEDR